MFQALIIGEDLRRVTEQVEASDLLGRSLEVAAAQADARWDVVVVGDHLKAIEKAACNALDGTTSPFRRVVQAVFGGVRGEGLPALVQQLGLAANRAAGLRGGTHTAFVFKDASLVNSLANHVGGGPRLVDRREQHGLVAVLAKPGQGPPLAQVGELPPDVSPFPVRRTSRSAPRCAPGARSNSPLAMPAHQDQQRLSHHGR